MNILSVNWRDPLNPLAGGAEVHLWENLIRLHKKGHNVTLISTGFKGSSKESVIDGIRILRTGQEWNFNYVAPFLIRKTLVSNNYDVLIEDINKIPFFSPLYVDIPIMGIVPHIFGKTIFYQTNPIFASYVYMWELPLTKVYKNIPFLVISPSTRDDMINRGFPSENIKVVYCGIDHESYYYDENIKRFKNPTILYVGRLKKYKSVQHIIESLAFIKKEIPNVKLLIVGEGDYKKELIKLVKKLNLEKHVEFTGFVTHEKKVEYLRKSHISVYPSLIEGWGLVNIEAAACGTPVIASNVSGLKDSVKDGETGYLYEYGNTKDLADKLIRILKNVNKKEYDMLVKKSLLWAQEYTWENSAEEMEKMIYDTIKRRFYGNAYSFDKE